MTMFKHTNKQMKQWILGADIGGSHISAAIVDASTGQVLEQTMSKNSVDAGAAVHIILRQWLSAMQSSIEKLVKLQGSQAAISGVGVSMPGPFDYEKGISLIEGLNKYESVYGFNILQAIRSGLQLDGSIPVVFENDASCFGLGESLFGDTSSPGRLLAITLGTGFGATFIKDHRIMKEGEGVPSGGVLYNTPYQGGIAENVISTRGIIDQYEKLSGKHLDGVKSIATLARQQEPEALETFRIFGVQLGECLSPWLKSFNADALIMGGSISKSAELFLPSLINQLEAAGIRVSIKISENMELSAIMGAAALVKAKKEQLSKEHSSPSSWRKTSQALMPQQVEQTNHHEDVYDIYPFQSVVSGKINKGYDSLAAWMASKKQVIIDGYVGVDWDIIVEQCNAYFLNHNISVAWYHASAFIKDEQSVHEMVKPFLGEEGSVWGTRSTLDLKDFIRYDKLQALKPGDQFDLNIIIGLGASLVNWDAPVIYVDLPKNELQYRMRAGAVNNIGSSINSNPQQLYKRFYFVDWVVLNAHRSSIKDRIAILADGQWKDDISWTNKAYVEETLQHMVQHTIRARPWFEAGAWGGQWLKEKIPALNKEEVNYAWSFELIVPENGIVFEEDGSLLELSFDWLMEYQYEKVLGKDASRFGKEFPIRFDFLDTFDGGNLSIQCHPRLDYIREHFGENLTQDETYYILDCREDAKVYLGFQEDIDKNVLKKKLEKSQQEGKVVDIENYVRTFPSHKHDLFLIPNGTVHSSGTNNLVLEISATPYIFTFKMYDWLRPDLNGKPRPINIEHAFNNLDFSRKGRKVEEELISKPVVLEENERYKLVHLPTHKDHFYDIHRIKLLSEATFDTNDQCHIMMLVEGKSVKVITGNETRVFHYAETFIIPAAAGSYTFVNPGNTPIKLVSAFVK